MVDSPYRSTKMNCHLLPRENQMEYRGARILTSLTFFSILYVTLQLAF
jgi:hypothetical protein